MISFIKNFFFNVLFKNWSPDVALRYLPIVSLIKKDRNIRTILDVGSGDLGITPYLKRKIIGLDTTFVASTSPSLKQIKGSATHIPFHANSFDVIICIDVLEHIPPKQRKLVIKEMLRVVKQKVILICPCDAVAEKEDKALDEHIRHFQPNGDPFLSEHLKNGLPSTQVILSAIPQDYSVSHHGVTNVTIHRLLMHMQITNSRINKFFSSVIFILCIPIFLQLNMEPTYRRLFIIRKN